MKTALTLLFALVVMTVSATAGTRCRTSTSGSVTYTTCDSSSGKTECRSSRSGSTTHTTCR
jgi:hypothetical protein